MSDALPDFDLWRRLAERPEGLLQALASASERPVEALAAAFDTLAAAGVPVAYAAGLYWCDAPVAPLAWSQPPAGFDATELHDHLPSTQDRALALLREGRQRTLVAAETQSAGRGRSGASWLSPLGAHLTFTLGWRFHGVPPGQLASLPVRLGVALARVLAEHGLPVRLKWPNDLWLHGRKLGGLLVEAHPAGSDTLVCVGLGLNHRMPPHALVPWPAQPWIDLAAARPGLATRTVWLERLLPVLRAEMAAVQAGGAASWAEEFARFDALAGCAVQYQRGDQALSGVVAGIAADGRLRVQVGHSEQCIGAGEVQLLRPEQRDVAWQLLLDCGNTRLKWAWGTLDGSAVLAGGALPLHGSDGALLGPERIAADLRVAIALLHQGRAPDRVCLCSSFGGDRGALRQAVAAAMGQDVADLRTPGQMGSWRSAYAQPTRLGLDRALAMRGALDLPGRPERTLLVSVGSALTVDLLARDGTHLGGLIAASPTLSMQALHRLSPRLDPAGARYQPLATDSPDAVHSASLQAAAGLIERVARQQRVALVLLSGGGAGPVQALLDMPEVLVQRMDTLVLRGLAHWTHECAGAASTA